MGQNKCIICGGSDCKVVNNIMYDRIICNKGFKFDINSDIFELNKEEQIRITNLIIEDILAHPVVPPKIRQYEYRRDDILIDKAGTINLFVMLKNYPIKISDRVDRVLINFANRYPKYGDIINESSLTSNLLFIDSVNFITETNGLLKMLNEMEYISNIEGSLPYYMISAKGWGKVEEIKKSSISSRTAFIAISFDNKTLQIRDCIRDSITKSGYNPILINEKEHNNQIVPEILYEIEKSRFVVVDITHGNYGAYFEAGYGTALGKEVIVCCRSQEFSSSDPNIKPHFDISQKSMVIWNDFEDLQNRLLNRIKATIR